VFEYQVDVAVVVCLDHLLELDDVLVIMECLQEHDLPISRRHDEYVSKRCGRGRVYKPEGTLGVGGVLECAEDLLEGHLILGLLVRRLPHDTIGLMWNRLVQ
jgi:hypothetical protein